MDANARKFLNRCMLRARTLHSNEIHILRNHICSSLRTFEYSTSKGAFKKNARMYLINERSRAASTSFLIDALIAPFNPAERRFSQASRAWRQWPIQAVGSPQRL